MKFLHTLLFVLMMCSLQAQTQGKISYKETIKMEFKFEGMDQALRDQLPKSHSTSKELIFNQNESLYKVKKGGEAEDLEMEAGDGSVKIRMSMTEEVEDIRYTNAKEKKYIHQKGIMSKSFLVKDDLERPKWKITNEKIKYLDYECQKATMEKDDKLIVAWFTTQIPYQIGPGSYHGLPGAILLLNIDDGKTEISAQSVTFENVEINPPKKGKKVNAEKFEKIKEEKMEEMKQVRGNVIIETRG